MYSRQQTEKFTLASECRHYITIQRATVTPDGEGGTRRTWTTTASVWAAIYPMRANRVYELAGMDVQATHNIKLTGYIDINEKDQILFDGRVFEVLTVENLQESEFCLWITCNELRK
jgi:SPP1 family predicted phage head-tail adaptor